MSERNELLIRRGTQWDPGLQIPVNPEGCGILHGIAQGVMPTPDISAAWPVKSIYITTSNQSAAALLGFGTWVEVDQDHFPNAHVWRRTA